MTDYIPQVGDIITRDDWKNSNHKVRALYTDAYGKKRLRFDGYSDGINYPLENKWVLVDAANKPYPLHAPQPYPEQLEFDF